MSIQVDVAILGGGPGGYTAAIRAAQMGKSVAIVEMDKVGGTCLHRGCIPSKALLRSAEVYRTLLNSSEYGIDVSTDFSSFQFNNVQLKKDEKVEQLFKGLQGLMKRHGIQVIKGKGRVVGPSIFSPRSGTIAVELADGEMESVVSQNLIIATGSTPRNLPGLEADGITILNSDQALTMDKLPESMLIVGGGVIGVEWASLLNDFGVQVTIVELGSRLLPGEDTEISLEMTKLLDKRGIRIITGVQLDISSYKVIDNNFSITATTADGNVLLEGNQILVSVGRKANCHDIGLENTDVRIKNDVIVVNDYGQTSEPHIYAIGDCIGGVQLAHAAAHEGLTAIDHIAGRQVNLVAAHLIPRCIYSSPEVASYGYTEAAAVAAGYEIKKARVPFAAFGKAIVSGHPTGFVKVIADKSSDDILGVHIIGEHATELISEAALSGWLNAAPWEVGAMVHPHPTLSEAIGEAMLAVDGRAISF
ncbi:dihydrolipoyl dehydrogenase [Paenibacillus endoradicis]|uniref:dihydrolipoyl dehydrogenase n=1 Tax=Paenibacillus endoradicis TaxID=2972487 RepID=UPI002158AE37|nr:dihydrolipoyl dehydrogenase [Paenibacillus endoradicis]MCR8660373.1 dihydrolipoyl dehydrogenase [Paenibacillus endoradicis]